MTCDHYDDFFLPDDQLPYDEKAFEKRLRKPPEAVPLLTKFQDQLAAADPFDAQTLENLAHALVEAEGIKVAQIIHALRVAATGKSIGFGLFESLEILGRQKCLARMDQAVDRVES